jgi:flagellar biosynthesis/type III secretory pathway protein FliH
MNALHGSNRKRPETAATRNLEETSASGSVSRVMDEMSSNSSKTTEGTPEMAAGEVSTGHSSSDLRKRRSTRIVQAVPVAVTGVDAIGRPFTEHTSTLIINCHGCRYQSKHYVLKNMWVKLEIPHPDSAQPARVVRGRVAWIQRPRTVRQLFQVALELETPGNVWGIAFPPEDWFAFPNVEIQHHNVGVATDPLEKDTEQEMPAHHDYESPAAQTNDNLRAFPSPASTTDASLQLARQLARLVADAKQQIQAAAREAASQAVAHEASQVAERIQQETGKHAQAAAAAAAEEARRELTNWLTPQLEATKSELISQLARDGQAHREQHLEQLKNSGETVVTLFKEAEEVATRLKSQAAEVEARLLAEAEAVGRAQLEAAQLREETSVNLAIQAEETEAHIMERADAAARTMEEAARVREEALVRLKAQAANTEAQIMAAAARAVEESERLRQETLELHWQTLRLAAEEVQQQVALNVTTARLDGEAHVARELEMAKALWQANLEASLHSAQHRIVGDVEQRLTGLRDSLQESTEKLEFGLARANEATSSLENFSNRLGVLHEQAIVGFHTQLDDVLSLHRNELHRRSESLFEDVTSRLRGAFEEASNRAAGEFEQRISGMVAPHLQNTEESLQRMAGGRSLLDAAISLQQDRIRAAADEAFAESVSRFKDNLGGAEQLLDETARSVTGRNIAEMEEKLSDIKHQAIQDVFKSAEWYEKKAQTHIQNVTEKAVEQASSQLKDKAGELSSVFTSELDHSGRNFVGHTQSQMEDAVRDAFERARTLFAEASDTTAAAFTDEVQRTGRHELRGFGEELQKSVEQARAELDSAQRELAQKITSEQAEFLRRFQEAMDKALESGVKDANEKVEASFSPLIDSWKTMTDRHQGDLRNVYAKISEQATEQHRTRLENVSNQWMLATVTALDHQSREIVADISANAEEKLRETCTQVFENIGETLQERLQQVARNLTLPTDPNSRTRSATTSSS